MCRVVVIVVVARRNRQTTVSVIVVLLLLLLLLQVEDNFMVPFFCFFGLVLAGSMENEYSSCSVRSLY